MADPKHGWTRSSARSGNPLDDREPRLIGCAWLIAVKGKPNEPLRGSYTLPASKNPNAPIIASLSGIGLLLNNMPEGANVIIHTNDQEAVDLMTTGKVKSSKKRNDPEFMAALEFATKAKARPRKLLVEYAGSENSPKMKLVGELAKTAAVGGTLQARHG